MGYLSNLCVGVIPAPDLLHRLGVSGPLEPVDRGNVEKMLGLFRNKAVGVTLV